MVERRKNFEVNRSFRENVDHQEDHERETERYSELLSEDKNKMKG